MRVRIAMMALSGLAMVAAGCSGGDTAGTGTTQPTKDLTIVSITPQVIFIEGTDIVTIKTTNGCGKDKVTIKIGDITLPGAQIQATDVNTYTFTAPADAALTAKQVKPVNIACSAAPDTSFKYGKSSADGSITYDPDQEPNPTIKVNLPTGNSVSVLAQMSVTFTRDMNEESVKADGAFTINEITGTVSHASGDLKTFIFKPSAELAYAHTYTATVKNSVKSALRGKALKPTIAANGGAVDPNQDTWSFQTRCEGCGNPWLGDISAAAGISSGGTYKLFSVTGQPTPVGEATNEQYKLQSGFIYATAPAATGGN